MNKKNVGILGGSFDPITKGHIQVAQYVLDNCKEIDEVWLSPCFNHMHEKKMISPKHRLSMCKLADKGNYNIGVFDFEISTEFSGSSYQLFTRLLHEPICKEYNLSLIVGQDNAENFTKWKDFEKLEKLIRFITVPRVGVVPDPNVNWYKQSPHIFIEINHKNVMEVSSTFVRNQLKIPDKKIDLTDFVDEKVYSYIKKHDLYT